VEAWVQRYNHEFGANDQAKKIVTDSAGNVIVAGNSSIDANAGSDFLLIKYTSGGVALWTNRYDGQANSDDQPTGLAADSGGNVYVTGSSYNGTSSDYATIAYSSAGLALWTNRYDGGGLYNGNGNGGDSPRAIAVGGNGNVYVTGSSYAYSLTYNDWYSDYATVAYSSAGVALWTNRYNGPGDGDDGPSAIAVGGNGNVYVTGTSDGNYTTIAYTSAGTVLWIRRYNGVGEGSAATALAVDGSGNVYVTGSSGNEFNPVDYVTVAYTSVGVALWTNRYNGPGDQEDFATAIAVGGGGNVYVTGYSVPYGDYSDYATIAYTSAGVALWTNRYSGPVYSDDRADAIAVDGSGNVNVMGVSVGSGGASDYTRIVYTSAGVTLSTNRYGPGQSAAIAADGSGKVYVMGTSSSGSSSPDYVTVAYTSAGLALWTNRYDGPGGIGSARASAVAVDGSGKVYVTGYSAGWGGYSDYATIAFTSSGVPLWTNRYHGLGSGGDQAKAIAVDGSGNLYVTGFSIGSSGYSDYATIVYTSAGVALWTNRYHGPANGADKAVAIAVDGSGEVFVTGSSVGSGGGSSSDYATIAYTSAGVALWTNRYHGPVNSADKAVAIATDGGGKVFVTGSSVGSGSSYDYATVAYTSAGVALWTNRHSGPGSSSDQANAIAVDGSGRVYVTGSSSNDYATIAYTGAGVALWTNKYNGPGNSGDYATAIAAGRNGNVYVTGYSYGESSYWDYTTIAYTSAGVGLWTNRYNGPGNSTDQPSAIAVDTSGNVYVTGSSGSDYATLAYSSVGVAWWTNRYQGPGSATAIAVDGNGNVYVAGYSTATNSRTDYALLKYVPSPPRLAIVPDGGSGYFVRYAGLTNVPCRLQRAATATGPWSDIATNMLEYQETFPPPGQGFYRTVQP
jgi:hypothetical protein